MENKFYNWEQITICITSCCNLSCKMCPVVVKKKSTLTREQSLHIAEFAIRHNIKRVVIGGGEPTLLPYLNEILELLSKHDLEIWLLTNAIRLTREDIEFYAQHPNIILNISFDGVGKVHDQIRGEGTFEKTLENFYQLIEQGAKISVNTVIQKSNFDKLVETYEYFKRFPISWHGFSFAEPYHQKELVPPENIPIAIKQLYEILKKQEKDGQYVTLSKSMIRSFEISLYNPELIMHPGENCSIPKCHIGIDEDGWVLPCWHYPWEKKEIRNINYFSLEDIVNNHEIRDEILFAVGPNGCKGCSTVCYFWNEEFRRKTMYPQGKWKVKREYDLLKKRMRTNYPFLYYLAQKIKRKII